MPTWISILYGSWQWLKTYRIRIIEIIWMRNNPPWNIPFLMGWPWLAGMIIDVDLVSGNIWSSGVSSCCCLFCLMEGNKKTTIMSFSPEWIVPALIFLIISISIVVESLVETLLVYLLWFEFPDLIKINMTLVAPGRPEKVQYIWYCAVIGGGRGPGTNERPVLTTW